MWYFSKILTKTNLQTTCNELAPLCHHFKAHRGVHIFLGARNQRKRKRPPKSKTKMDGERRTRLFPFDGAIRVQLRGHPQHLPHMCIINIWIYTLIPEREKGRALSSLTPQGLVLQFYPPPRLCTIWHHLLHDDEWTWLLNLPGFRMTNNPLQSDDMTFKLRLNNHYLLQDMLSV